MFAKALDKASGFIRPVHAIIRYYNEWTAKPSAYNIFFINEHGVAVTARHVAKVLEQLAGGSWQSVRREGLRFEA